MSDLQDTRIWLYDSDSRPLWLWCEPCGREFPHEVVASVRPRVAQPGADLVALEVRCESCGHVPDGRPSVPGWST